MIGEAVKLAGRNEGGGERVSALGIADASKSGCGWPSYFDSIPGAVTRHEDNSGGMQRTEIICSNW